MPPPIPLARSRYHWLNLLQSLRERDLPVFFPGPPQCIRISSAGQSLRSLPAKRPINAGASLARLARIGGANLVSSQELNGRTLAQEAPSSTECWLDYGIWTMCWF